MILIKGKNSVYEAIKAGSTVRSIYVSANSTNHPVVKQIANLAKFKNIPFQVVAPKEFSKRFTDKNNQHIVAEIDGIKNTNLEEITNNPEKYTRLLLLDHLEDPFNFGAIIRSSVALGVDAVIYPKDRQVSINSGVIQASAGAVYKQTLVQVTNLAQAADNLNKAGFWLIGTDVNNGTSLPEADIQTPWALVVGNESKGISKRVSKMTHINIHIPTTGKTESLNVSVATGIVLYQLINNAK